MFLREKMSKWYTFFADIVIRKRTIPFEMPLGQNKIYKSFSRYFVIKDRILFCRKCHDSRYRSNRIVYDTNGSDKNNS